MIQEVQNMTQEYLLIIQWHVVAHTCTRTGLYYKHSFAVAMFDYQQLLH